MSNGCKGKILHINLTDETLDVEEPPEAFYRKYLGGSAMGLHYILKHMGSGADPLGLDNVLTMMLSIFTGTPISGQSRMSANAKSPLVDGIGDSQSGGFFPAEMKFAGFDGLVIRGGAARPVYLWLNDGRVEVRDATHLWGRTTSQVEAILKEELRDDKIEIAQCGPSGEKAVRLSAIINMANRANGRTGMGAVMGAKNLKAVVVRGSSKQIPIAHPKSLNELARKGAKSRDGNPDVGGLHTNGTAEIMPSQHLSGGLPSHNYRHGQFADFEAISGEVMTQTILKGRDTCYACAVRCKRVVETEWLGRPVEGKHGGPEYETLATFGSYCGVGDLHAIAYANKLCNEYGLDTIGTGATIAWAMECYEMGVLSEQEVGFPLRFGDAEAMIHALEILAIREGFGDLLAEGSRRAAERLGKGHEYLITVKGSELPAHMPQVKRSLGLIYAVNPFGADHQSSEHDPTIEEGTSESHLGRLGALGFDHALRKRSLDEDKVRFALKTQYFYSFLDSADLCQFVFGPGWALYGPEEALELVHAVTGWDDFDIDELLRVGERRLCMLRLFNAREGLGRENDQLPGKLYRALKGSGPSAGVALSRGEIERAKDIYYRMAGWDVDTGNPSPQKLAELGLE